MCVACPPWGRTLRLCWLNDQPTPQEKSDCSLLAWVPLQVPKSVWLSGLFNPQSFLTAVMQVGGNE